MKKLVLIFLLTGLLAACKKDKSPAIKETALSKVFQDGIMTNEFIYSPQRQLSRFNGYDEKTGKFTYGSSLEYNSDGNIILENQYSSSNKLVYQVIYTYQGDKIQTSEYKSLSGNDSGKIVSRIKFSYDLAGRVGKQSWVDLVTDKVVTSRELTYFQNGNLESSSIYGYNPAKQLQWKTEYSPAGDPLPPSLVKFKGYPINFLLYDLVTQERHFYLYTAGVLTEETKDIFNNRKYDSEGYLSEQTINPNKILPAALSKAIKMRYEYVKI